MILRLKHIWDEIFNNLTTKRVVCPNVVQNVGTSREHQNDQVCTRRLREFLRGGYNEGNESFSAYEDNVASFPNLKNMWWKKATPIRHNNWCKRECDLLDPKGIFLARGHVTIFDPKEAILDDILRHDHVGLNILYCSGDISMVMISSKWPLLQITMEGLLLKELLFSCK